jgi:hypothetical protein
MLALMLGKSSCKVEKFKLIRMNPCDMGLTASIGGIQEEIIFQTFFLWILSYSVQRSLGTE